MIFDILTKNRTTAHLVIYGLAGLCILTGCASEPQKYKEEADQKVYSIIEQKWTDDLPSPANFRISDVPPGPNDIQIERIVPISGVLTLPQAVAIATAHNRQYQLEKEALYVMALDLRLARHEFEPWFFGIGGGGYATTGGDDGVGAAANFGLNQLLATGARISTQVAINWVRILTGDLEGGLLTSVLSANVTQPLLRGSDRRIVLENLTQAERNTLYQIRSFNRFRKTFVVSIITQYYRVLQQLDTAKNADHHYHRLLSVEQKLEHLTGAGKLPRHELQQAHQDTLDALDTYIETQKLYKQALDEFKLQLSLPTDTQLQLDENELAILAAADMSSPDFSEDEALETALSQRLDLDNSADAIADAERKTLVAADNLRPELNLVANASIPSRELSTSEAKTLNDVFAGSLQLDLNLDKELQKNVYRKSLITLEQQKRTHEEISDIVVLQVRQDYRDLLEAAQSYQIQKEGLELAQKRFDDTMLLMQYGRASSRRVLDAQKDLFRSQNAATEALVNYTVATLNFYRDTGILQVRPDGMWTGEMVSDEPAETHELQIIQEEPELQTEQVAPDAQEIPEQPAPQIEPEPIKQPAQITSIDAEEYITQWMNQHKGN
jgi:outer membrane protein TolC